MLEAVSLEPNISSIYIMRPDGIRYYSDKATLKPFTYASILETPVYKTIAARNGGYVVTRNAGGVIDNGIEYFSFMRIINSLKTIQPMGLLCINVEFENIFNPRKEPIQILDGEEGSLVLWNNEDSLVDPADVPALFDGQDSFSVVRRIQNKNYVLVGVKNRNLSMTFVRLIPVYDAPLPLSMYMTIIALTILLNGFLFIFGSFWISRYISRPVRALIAAIEGVYNGNFNYVTTIHTKDEIGRFQDVYNVTIQKIQQLISDIIEEQKALRRAELEITIAQINPHFLYNTLNTVNSLAVMGKNAEVSEPVKALGDFYKSSLNNGEDLITLEKELDSIRSYVYIQQLRYEGLFRMEYDVQPEALGVRVPKMILQPLVENSIYHGIRTAAEEDGLIKIRAWVEESMLRIEVTDNGAGMNEERLQEVLLGKSIGIGATMRRIAIICGESSEFKISSALGEGTTVSIKMTKGL